MRWRRRSAFLLGLGVSLGAISPSLSSAQESNDFSGVVELVSSSAIVAANQGEQIAIPKVFELGPIQGAAEPEAPLDYLFTIDPIAPRDGNAALYYLEALSALSSAELQMKGSAARWEYDWLNDDSVLPMDEVAVMLETSARTMELIERGAACSYCDFGGEWANSQGVNELISVNLESHQRMRRLMRYLMVEVRYSLHIGDYDRAARGLTCLFEIANDTKSPDLLITNLIGTAGNGIALALCQEWIAKPGSPNIFWALTSLRADQTNNRQGLLGELRLCRFGIEAFDHPETRPWTSEQWIDSLADDLRQIMQLPEARPDTRVMVSAMLIRDYPIAKESLLAQGWDPIALDEMPVAKVVCIDASRKMAKMVDERMKWGLLNSDEYRQALANAGEAGFWPPIEAEHRDTLFGTFIGSLLPAVNMAHEASVRVDTQLQMLRTIEAIRLHVHATGQIPQSLDEIKVVPVPVNPRTSSMFEYRVTETHVELEAKDIRYGANMGIVYRFSK